MTTIGDQDVSAWLDAFATCVRDRDLDRGRTLFSPDAVGFGTVARRYEGIDELVGEQWSEVWSRTEEFTFDAVDHRWLDGSLCAVAATWHSVGTDGDGRRRRTGRATLVLHRTDDGLRATHSHFSITPGTTG